MTDESTDTPDANPTPQPAPNPRRPLQSARATLGRRDARGRPLAVYGIIGVGVATLLILMMVIYFTTGDRGKDSRPICTAISPDHAETDIRAGNVETFTVVYSEEVVAPSDPDWGPVQAQVEYVDGSCGYLPQGITNRDGILVILGAIAFYNQNTDNAQVKVVYAAAADLDRTLFQAPTVSPTETALPTQEVPVTPTEPAASPQAVPTGTPVGPPAPPETPDADSTP